jgi:exopolysaccharide biosynthesis polyprenyl glycosylphosphotransferase
VCATLGRLSFYRAHLRGRRAGEGMRRTLVVGAGTVGRLLTRRLVACPELGLAPVGYVDEYPLELQGADDMPLLGRASELEDIILRHRIEHVVFSFSAAREEDSVAALSRCEQLGVGISVVPRLFEKTTSRLEVDHLGGLPLVHLPYLSPVSWQFAMKHGIDRVFAAVALLLLSPVLVAAALAVRVSLGSPILFRQRRVGRDGRVFTILKFRSMRPGDVDAPESTRLTRVGDFIRRTSIDELPQLFNVLKGEMSLVGPRPERPELVQSFERTIHRYDERHRVKSGITGWAQVHGIGRGADRFGDVSLTERVEWDNFYIENWSLWLDAKIAMMTMLAVLRFRQAT